MNKTIVALSIAAALAVGAGAGYWLAPRQAAPASSAEQAGGERKALFWRNPMNPAITSPVFAKDEMGMDYIPVYADAGGAAAGPAGTVTIDPTVVQNIGVRTAPVERRPLARQLTALGQVDFNEERLARLHPKSSGWVEELRIDQTGVAVKRDTILLSLYSPELVAAQQEYLVALANAERFDNAAAKSVLQSARARLERFDVPTHQIHELEQNRKPLRLLHIHSPFEGRVMQIGARQGQYISPADQLYLIADLSRIWVWVDVFEDDLPWIKLGDKAELQVRAAPGRVFKGAVTFISPMQERQSRTVRVRLEFDNPGLLLKPGMFANVVLHADARPAALVVPSEAIVRSGLREQLFVAKGEGRFEPREVRLGISAGAYTEILSGVEPGEEVLVSGQFLIDSESKLREATAKMLAPKPAALGADMNMDDMDMDDAQGGASVAGGRTPGATELDMSGMSMPEMDKE